MDRANRDFGHNARKDAALGTPTLDWSMAGQSQHETLSVEHGDGFASALQRLRDWLRARGVGRPRP